MNSDLGQDLPVLVALVRAQERLRSLGPSVTLDIDKLSSRLRSEEARRLARALLLGQDTDPTVQAKAADLRKLALGR